MHNGDPRALPGEIPGNPGIIAAHLKAETKREKSIQNEILRTFGTRPDMRIWRQNTGVAKYRGRNGPRTVVFGVPGQADITGILPDGRRLEIEVKSATGTQTPEQRNYQAIIERFGGVYVLARSVQDVWNAIGGTLGR